MDDASNFADFSRKARLSGKVKEVYWYMMGDGAFEQNVFINKTFESYSSQWRNYMHCYATLYDGGDAGMYAWSILYEPVGVIVWFKEPGSTFDMFVVKNWVMAC